MNQPPDARQLQLDWIDALSVVKAARLSRYISDIYHRATVRWADKDILPAAVLDHSEAGSSVLVQPSVCEDYRVERIEILTYCAAEVLCHILGHGPDRLEGLCKTLGCAPTRLRTVRERWRRIGVYQESPQVDSLVSHMFEDRPQCGWCKGALVSGSTSLVRKDLHEGCYDHIMLVVRPQLIAAREAEKRAYAAGVDK